MSRTETEIMEGWEFALEEKGEKRFRPVTLPHDWGVEVPFDRDMEEGEQQGFHNRFGIGWYRRKLFLPEKPADRNYRLEFGGISENSTVWINGREAGGRKYGYSTFRLDVTELVQQGENRILVKVDNTRKPADRWYSGAGIYRTVKWVETDRKHLDDWEIVIKTEVKKTECSISGGREGSQAGVYDSALVQIDTFRKESVKAFLREPQKEQKLQGLGKGELQREKPESAGQQGERLPENRNQGREWQADSDEEGRIRFVIPSPRLWSAEDPCLYELELILYHGERECDRIRKKIGIRNVEFRSREGMYVNGRPVKLKGVCLHQEAGCRGIAVRKEVWKKRLESLKDMGCNAVRPAHHTFSEEFMDLCDQMGFYVYEECFDKWTGGLYGRYFETEWKADMEAMIKRDRNRPSVVIWGVGNEVENQGQDSMLRILKMLTDYAKQLDGTRPVSYAMNPHFKRESNEDVSRIRDIQKFVDEVSDTEIYDSRERVERICRIGAIADILSCNYQEQWYSLIHEAMPDKLILGTEVYQFFQGEENHMQNFTEENPALVPEKYPYCIGSMLWTGIDYLGESCGYPSRGWSGAVIRTNGVRRPMYYVMQSYWTKKPVLYFSVMDYSLRDEGGKEHWSSPIYEQHWHFPQFHRTVVPYMIATNCDEVELYVNEKRFRAPVRESRRNGMITGYLPYQPGCITAVGYREGKEVCREEIRTPGPAVKLAFEEEAVRIPAQRNYELMLTVRAEDEEGNFYFRESSTVLFRAEGPAEIIGVDNGNMMSWEPYRETGIHLYHGRASVMLRLSGLPGRVKVTAWAEGMKEGVSIAEVSLESPEGV